MATPEQPSRFRRWWNDHFTGFTRREAWGYGVWLFFAVIVLVPELWAATDKDSAPFPTISATVGELEYNRPWIALVVTATIVLCLYGAFRYPRARTGVLATREKSGAVVGETLRGDQALPFRTPGGGRLTASTSPVRELPAIIYFLSALGIIAGGTTIAVIAKGGLDEFAVGRTLYGLMGLFWVLIPSLLAWPKKWAVDVPFPTLFSTVRSLERRLRFLAYAVAAGLTILLIHLVLYPWPSIIPDLSRTHRYNKCHPLTPPKKPPTAKEIADCKKLDETEVKPSPTDP